MFRIALTAFMILQSLTGMNPCCCKTARLGFVMRVTTGVKHDVPLCCSGAVATGSQERLADGSDDSRQVVGQQIDMVQNDGQEAGGVVPVSRSPVPRERCKCEKLQCNAVPSPEPSSIVQSQSSWLDELVLSLAATEFLVEVPCTSQMAVHPDGTLPATRSGREIRVALNSWQC